MAFAVDTDRINAAAGDITRNADEIETSVTALAGRLQGLQGAWTGAAATEFQDVVVRWQSLQRQVREDLSAIGQLLAKAGVAYSSAEDDIRRMFSH